MNGNVQAQAEVKIITGYDKTLCDATGKSLFCI
jgi:hypothetical protein